jgi:Ca2+-binding EF-hand superfamily protein
MTCCKECAEIGGGPRLDLENWIEALVRVGYSKVEDAGRPLFHFLDVTNDGTVSVKEFQTIDSFTHLADIEEVDELFHFLVERINDVGTPEQRECQHLETVFQIADKNGTGKMTYLEFLRAMEHLEWDKGFERELFAMVDAENTGVLSWDEFRIMGLLSSTNKLRRIERVRDFLLESFPNWSEAYKRMDPQRTGQLELPEWKLIMEELEYPSMLDVESAFYYCDKDCSDVVTPREFDVLMHFDREAFEQEVEELRRFLQMKYGNVDEAFQVFRSVGGKNKNLETKDMRVNLKEFASGFRRMVTQDDSCEGPYCGSMDPKILFNFVDSTHSRIICHNDWDLLVRFDEVDGIIDSAAFMQGAIEHFRHFFRTTYPALDQAYQALLDAVND